HLGCVTSSPVSRSIMPLVSRLCTRCCRKPVQAILAVAFAFLCAGLGQVTRPDQGLSILWPANALLAGLLIRRPALGHPLFWAGAFCGLALAGLFLEDQPWPAALGYGITDLSGVFVAWIILSSNWTPARMRSSRGIGDVFAACDASAATNASIT